MQLWGLVDPRRFPRWRDKILNTLILGSALAASPIVSFRNGDGTISTAKRLYRDNLPRDVLVRHRDAIFSCRPGNIDIYLLSQFSENEEWELVRPDGGDTVVDIGAHVGKYAIPSAKSVGAEGEVVALEAVPEHYEALEKNININGLSNCTAINEAAYNENGEKWLVGWDLHDEPDPDHPEKEHVNPAGSLKVTTRRVDNLLDDLGIETINLVKIDIGRQEVEVLEGMESTLERSRDVSILVEVGEANEDQVDDILKGIGFKKEPLGEWTSSGLRDILYTKHPTN